MAQRHRFWDRIAGRYAKTPIKDVASYERKLDVTQRYLTPASKVLEIGCGTGSTAVHHAPNVAHIRAVDVSGAMLDIARAKAHEAGVSNITFDRAEIDAIEAKPGAYDMVMAHSILHLLTNPGDVIAKAFDWLVPGGTLISSTACLMDNQPYLRFLLPVLRPLRLVPEASFFTQAQLVDWTTDAGFEIEESWRPGKNAAVFIVARKPG